MKRLYKEMGDYGTVAESLLPSGRPGPHCRAGLPAAMALPRLRARAPSPRRPDPGRSAAPALRPGGPVYVAHSPGRLRLGIGDPTIMDGLSFASRRQVAAAGARARLQRLLRPGLRRKVPSGRGHSPLWRRSGFRWASRCAWPWPSGRAAPGDRGSPGRLLGRGQVRRLPLPGAL